MLYSLSAFGAASLPAKQILAATGHSHRTLAFVQTHTGEKGRFTYWEDGEYVPEALLEISWLLRDHRTGDMKLIDRNLLDQLTMLQYLTDSTRHFDVISGYRSPETNDMLFRSTDGVEEDSFHMYGRAIDVRLPDVQLAHLHKAATALQAGGVGYYPSSTFLHLDTGPVRNW